MLLETSKNQDAIKSEISFHGIIAVEGENNGFEKNPHKETTKRRMKNYNPEKNAQGNLIKRYKTTPTGTKKNRPTDRKWKI